jgi:hypothetical protein
MSNDKREKNQFQNIEKKPKSTHKKNVNSTNSLFRIWDLNNLTKRKVEQTTKLKVNKPISN